jgi:chromosome segregation ATPase
MLETSLKQIRSQEAELVRLRESVRTLEARDAKRDLRIKFLESELAKAHGANRNLKAQLLVGPADARRESALKLAAERATEAATFKQQAAELGAQKAKLTGELNEFKARADSTFKALKKALEEQGTQLKEREAQLKDLSAEFDRISKTDNLQPDENPKDEPKEGA